MDDMRQYSIYCRCDMEIKQLQKPLKSMPAGIADTFQSRRSLIAYKPAAMNQKDPPLYTSPLLKEQHPPPVPQRTSTYRGGDMSESMMSDYLAPQGGDSDSATYYILENMDELTGKRNP